MQSEDNYTVRITEPCRYCPEGKEPQNLAAGDEIDMAGADAFNIVSSGRGRFINPEAVPSNLKSRRGRAQQSEDAGQETKK